MDSQTLLTVLMGAVLVIAVYSTMRLRGKALCVYRSRTRQQIEKFAPIKKGYVIFDEHKYDLLPDRASLFWYNRGINQFFPTWVIKYDFAWDNRFPFNPDTYKITRDMPTVRNALNFNEKYQAFAQGVDKQAKGGKVTFIDKYGVWIAIGLVLVIGF